MMDKRKIQRMLLQAQKDNERSVTGIIGKTDDADETTIYSNAEKTEVWVRINGMAEPYSALISDPAAIVPLARVYLKYDVEASRWVVAGVNASANNHFFQNIGGFTFAIQPHNHTSSVTGDDLGPDTVGTAQIQADAVTQTELADDSVGTAQIQAGAVGNSELANDAVKVGNLNNLTASTNGYVRQNTSDQFLTEKLAFVNGTSPTTSDDSTQGYLSFSKWMDWANEKLWMAFDVFPSSASWKRFLFSGEVVPTDADTLTGSSAAFVTQTASDTFSSIDYTLPDNSRLFYDGSKIRQAYGGLEQPNTTLLTVSSTTWTDVIEITIPGTDISNGSKLDIVFEPRFYGNVVGDIPSFRLQYYNGSGYTTTGGAKPYQILVSNSIITSGLTWFIDQSALVTPPDVDGSGNYLWKVQLQRTSGTGNIAVNRSNATLLRVIET